MSAPHESESFRPRTRVVRKVAAAAVAGNGTALQPAARKSRGEMFFAPCPRGLEPLLAEDVAAAMYVITRDDIRRHRDRLNQGIDEQYDAMRKEKGTNPLDL